MRSCDGAGAVRFASFDRTCLDLDGYLQAQFAAWTHSPALAVLLQGVVFGVSYGYQAWRSTVVITVFGILFGALTAFRGSVRAGILAHAATDLLPIL